MSFWKIPPSGDWFSLSAVGSGTARIDSAAEGEGGVCIADRAVSFDRIGVYVGSILNPPTYRIGFQSISGRLPTGTYLGATNSGYGDVVPSIGMNIVTLGESVTVAKGDAFALTIMHQTGTIDATHYADFIALHNIPDFNPRTPYGLVRSGSVWAVNSTALRVMPIATDGTMYPGIALLIDQDQQNAAWNSGSSPVMRGNGITMVPTKRLQRVVFLSQLAATSVVNVELWKEGDSAALATSTITTDTNRHSTSFGWDVAHFNQTLDAGSTYFFVLKPTTAANVTTFRYVRFYNDEARKAYAGGLFAVHGVAGSPPTWTKYNTVGNGFRMYAMWPEFDDITLSSGGGDDNTDGGMQ